MKHYTTYTVYLFSIYFATLLLQLPRSHVEARAERVVHRGLHDGGAHVNFVGAPLSVITRATAVAYNAVAGLSLSKAT